MQEDTFRWVVAAGVGIATLSIVVMAIVTIVLYRAFAKLKEKTEGLADSVDPILRSVRTLVAENSPKISGIVSSAEETASNVRDISGVAKEQACRFAEVGRDIADRAKVQVARVDAAVDETVDQVQHLGANVKYAAMKPVHEFSSVLAGIRAAVSAYSQGRRPDIARVTQDEEMFI